MTASAVLGRLVIRVGSDDAVRPVIDCWPVDGGCGDTVSGGPPGVSRHEFAATRLLLIGDCLLTVAQRDSALAAAVRDGGLDRVADWPGAFSVIVVGPRTVTGYADQSEQFPLYYARRGAEILIGPDPGVLAAAHDRRPDPLTAAAHLCCPAVLPLWSGRSPYTGVSRVPGGAVLRVAPGSATVVPPEVPLPVPGLSLAEGASQLRDALVGSVRARCAGRLVSTDFSGGLDSTSLAFLAAGHAAGPVTALAYHQPLAPAGDLPYAIEYAELDQRLRLTVITGSARTLPFAGLSNLAGRGNLATQAGHACLDGLGDLGSLYGVGGSAEALARQAVQAEPHPGWLVAARSLARLAAARRSGARLHLTGEGGDAVLMAAPSYLASLARTGNPLTLLRHSGGYARLRQAAPAGIAAAAVRLAGQGPGRALAELAAELTFGDGHGTATRSERFSDLIAWWAPSGEAASWLTVPVRRQLAELAADPAAARAIPAGVGPADLAALADLRRSGDAQRQLRALATPLGLQVHAPLLDGAVIRAALSVSPAVRANPWSYKPLLAAALTGLVPDQVLNRRTKGDYAAEDYTGARAVADELRALLRDSRLADLGVIEPGAVASVVDRMTVGLAVPLGPLNTLLATEVWLRCRDGARTGELARC